MLVDETLSSLEKVALKNDLYLLVNVLSFQSNSLSIRAWPSLNVASWKRTLVCIWLCAFSFTMSTNVDGSTTRVVLVCSWTVQRSEISVEMALRTNVFMTHSKQHRIETPVLNFLNDLE